jgi:hypothetical protein
MKMLPILYTRQIKNNGILFFDHLAGSLWGDGLKKSLKLLGFLFLENDKIPTTWKISNYVNQNQYFIF